MSQEVEIPPFDSRERMFSEFEVFLIKSLIVAANEKFTPTSAQAKALASGNLSPKMLVDLATLAGLEKNPEELVFRVRRASGRIPLNGGGVADSTSHARELAYKIWTQLTTRVLAVAIDWDRDDLLRVYDSWHQCYQRIRTICEETPLWRDADPRRARRVLLLTHSLLNDTMRAHLTLWHTEFREWHAQALKEKSLRHLSTATRQKKFSKFGELSRDFAEKQELIAEIAAKLKEEALPMIANGS